MHKKQILFESFIAGSLILMFFCAQPPAPAEKGYIPGGRNIESFLPNPGNHIPICF
jgi:hypothetical protein